MAKLISTMLLCPCGCTVYKRSYPKCHKIDSSKPGKLIYKKRCTMDKKLANKKASAVKHSFKQDSKEFKYLLKLFKTGKIPDNAQPAAIRTAYPCFAKFTANQFRPQFHKAKGLSGSVSKSTMG